MPENTAPADVRRSILVVHPSADRYGSDRQLIESLIGLDEAGWRVVLVLPSPGPLVGLVSQAVPAIDVRIVPFVAGGVLRKALLRPLPFARLALRVPADLARAVRLLRSVDAHALYVNTVTLPLWPLAGRLARVPALVHVHEAEEDLPRVIRSVLAVPLLFASLLIANSRSSARVLEQALPVLRRRTRVVVNGVAVPGGLSGAPALGGHLALVARLSPRKGIDVALEAVAPLRSSGREVTLDVCGTTFAGYEWYEAQLRHRADQPDLAGAVAFRGYVAPTGPALERATAVLVPSRTEPFGNTAVEALLSDRPVIASAVQGLAEIVTEGRTGLLVPPDDAEALATAIGRVLDEPELARDLARRGRDEARERFSQHRYRVRIADLTAGIAQRMSDAP